jgi:hypothetical protein
MQHRNTRYYAAVHAKGLLEIFLSSLIVQTADVFVLPAAKTDGGADETLRNFVQTLY